MIGTQVGPFTIVCPLGDGGMASVYLAEHAVLKTRRAVKFLSPPLTQNPLLVHRFVNEARAAAQLHHRNLIQVHDVGQLPSGAWFMVLDYLDGHTLGRFMARRAGPLPPLLIVHIISEIANGLSAAHRQRIVHRDLKPENVFLIVRDGDPHRAVVIDFGVAQLDDEPVTGRGTRSGVVIGTPAYMSAEQLRGHHVTPAADIFALGVLAYQMSTGGWFPYQRDESHQGYCELPAIELYHRQMTRPPVDPRDRGPGLAAAWVDAVLAAVNPDPALRPATAGAFALRLAQAVPPVGLLPGGLAVVRTYARELAAPRGLETDRPLAPPEPVSRYQLGDKLGAGGMAEVFAGTMVGVEGFVRRVAIKRVLSGLSQVPAFATMFVAEARIASRLAHPNIVSVLDFSRDPEDRLFLVMEYVDGQDLASVLDAGPIPPSLAIFIVVEMLRGLGYAHDLPDSAEPGAPGEPMPLGCTRGVIHRDVSPQNLLLSHEGAVKVSDFGLAKARAASDGVRSDTVRGKPGYMSPEQCSGELLDGRTDLYSVGVMLWEMLAHRALFAGTSKEILAQVMFKDVPAPSSVRSRVPPDLEAIAMKLLARDRDARYPTAEAAIEALLRCDDAPRDGRGELASLLAERFPRAGGARSSRMNRPVPPGLPRALRAAQITVAAPPSTLTGATSRTIRIAVRPHRGMFAVTVSGAVLGCLAAAVVIARGEVARSGTTDRATQVNAPRLPVAPSSGDAAPLDAGIAGGLGAPSGAAIPAGRVDPAPRGSGARSGEPARPRPAAPPRHDRVTRTGELAINVQPGAMIWLNGKPSGQTPFRGLVPAGQYRIRLANDDVGHDEITVVTVEPDRTATVERSW